MPVGGKPRNITNDAAFDADPARFSLAALSWSIPPDKAGAGCYSCGYGQQERYERQQPIPTQPISPPSRLTASVSPIWMWTVCGGVRRRDRGGITGKITHIHAWIRARPAHLVAGRQRGGDHGALLRQISRRHQLGSFHGHHGLAIGQRRSLRAASPFHRQPGWNGPVWSPDGSRMVAVYEGSAGFSGFSRATLTPRRVTK